MPSHKKVVGLIPTLFCVAQVPSSESSVYNKMDGAYFKKKKNKGVSKMPSGTPMAKIQQGAIVRLLTSNTFVL